MDSKWLTWLNPLTTLVDIVIAVFDDHLAAGASTSQRTRIAKGKRLIKAPKPYLTDSGLASHLLGLETQRDLERSPFRGPLFEGFIASEIIKQQINQG